MNRRQKIIVSVTGIFLVILILVGLTYAFFVTRIRGNNNPTSISVTTANLVVEYTDGDSNGDGVADAYMAFEKIQPSDTITYTKVFNVENKGNDTASYSVILDEMTNEFERNQDLQYTLTRSGETDPVASGYLAVGTHQVLTAKEDINVGETHIYTLTIKYDEAGIDQSVDMNKTLSFKVDIDNERVTWDTATEGTLLYAIKNTKTDSTMGSTEDDYGMSYYYKGAVTNNYVNYSGMCWRIVRVQGDGTIKLVLADDEHECNDGYSLTDDKSAFLQVYEGTEDYDIGYTNWAVPFSVAYSFDYNESNIYEFLSKSSNNDNWLSKLSNSKLLTNTSWCNDLSISRVITYPTGGGYSIYDRHYGSYERAENNSPSLKCNFKGENSTASQRINDKVALLTIDEILFAKDNGTTSYLTTNANGVYVYESWGSQSYGFWTMSPGKHYEGAINSSIENPVDYMILTNGIDKEYSDKIGPYGTLRPAIAIKSDVILDKTITGQNGTYTNPYEIG